MIWGFAVLCAAGLTHILAILILPQILAEKTFASLSQEAKPQGISLLKDLPAPFADPLLSQGVCLYDLTKGMLLVRTKIPPGRFLTFSFHAKTGQVFYSFTDRAAQNGLIDVVLLNESQSDSLDEDDERAGPSEELRITAPADLGFMLVKALRSFPSEKPEADALIQSISCKTEPLK